jgi:hypothetical protein
VLRDLSKHHQPIGDLFAPPPDADWDRYQLTSEQIEFYEATAAGEKMQGHFFPLLFDPKDMSCQNRER